MVATGHGLCVCFGVCGETTKNKEESKIVNVCWDTHVDTLSRLTPFLLYPSLSCRLGLWDMRRLTGYKPFCCLAFQLPSAEGGAGIYFHLSFAFHPHKKLIPSVRLIGPPSSFIL